MAPVSRELLGFDGSRSILEERDFGIWNGRVTALVPFRDAFSVGGLYAPPLAASSFVLDVRIDGERVPTSSYRWYPSEVLRSGQLSGMEVETSTILAPGMRAGLVTATLRSVASAPRSFDLLVALRGGLERTPAWEFHRPRGETPLDAAATGDELLLRNAAGAVAVRSDLPGLRWNPITRTGSGMLRLAPLQELRLVVSFALGEEGACREECRRLRSDPLAAAARAREHDAAMAAELFARLPRLEAEPRLEGFYLRSLLALPLHRWEVPELILHPYYGVGSIGGGVLGCYLWDFSIGARMLAMYDPAALREHILRFLEAGVERGYGFNPVTGEPFGSWYALNPERMVWTIREYVAHTGDIAILEREVRGKRVLEHAIDCALFGDESATEPHLVDYREEKYHLELRRGFAYDNYVPDLNGRRYGALYAAADLAAAAGRPDEALRERARALPRLLREKLWSPEDRWFRFIDAAGRPGLRYTNEMFALIGSGAIDAGQEEALVSHLNEEEFLSSLGMHSISKRDPAYDPEDVDHGGGGCFAGIAGEIVERLYGAGRASKAEEILRRILWWGQRMPYWGDSMYADRVDYRRDTPYQCALPAVGGAQAIIFGMFGLAVGVDGRVSVNPRPPSSCPAIALRGVRVRGLCFDLEADPSGYTVRLGSTTLRGKIGEPLELPAG